MLHQQAILSLPQGSGGLPPAQGTGTGQAGRPMIPVLLEGLGVWVLMAREAGCEVLVDDFRPDGEMRVKVEVRWHNGR